MRTRRFLVGFGITVGVIVLVTATSRMALQGSLLGGENGASSSSAAPVLEPLGDPLSADALTRVRYVVADSSVRYALASAGLGFAMEFGADGVYTASKKAAGRSGVDGAYLDLSRIAVGDIDGDRRPDAAVPLIVTAGALTFSEVALVRNLGQDAGEYLGGYPLGISPGITGISLRPDGTMHVDFSYVPVPGQEPIDAGIDVVVRQARDEKEENGQESSASASR